ncbi:MAG: class I SAM-dependent methyltransferase [Solirubrobacterales bacterium]
MDDPNSLFSLGAARRLAGHTHRMARAEEQLVYRLSEPRTRGLRAWEYGVLLGYLQQAGPRPATALDVGSGNSAFPRYLARSRAVGSMTVLDLPEAFEARDEGWERNRRHGVGFMPGSMTEIPSPADRFDLVTSISAIEHLDGHAAAWRRDPEGHPRASYEAFVANTRTALREMVRVLRPGGTLFVTSDAYLADLQRGDNWMKAGGPGEIWSAYRFEDIEGVFVRTLTDEGLVLVGEPGFDRGSLEADATHSTYRGRYFTTFAVLGTLSCAPG